MLRLTILFSTCVSLVACPEIPSNTPPGSCQGCLIAEKTCSDGVSDSSCGAKGQACEMCVAGVSTCIDAKCRSVCERSLYCTGQDQDHACVDRVCVPVWGNTAVLDSFSAQLPLVYEGQNDEPNDGVEIYVKLEVDGSEVFRSAVAIGSELPSWDAQARFVLQENSNIVITVWDQDAGDDSTDDLIGGVNFIDGNNFMETAGSVDGFDQMAGQLTNLAFAVTFSQ